MFKLQFIEGAKQFLIIKSFKKTTTTKDRFVSLQDDTNSELYIDCDTVSSTLSNLFLVRFFVKFWGTTTKTPPSSLLIQ